MVLVYFGVGRDVLFPSGQYCQRVNISVLRGNILNMLIMMFYFTFITIVLAILNSNLGMGLTSKMQ